MIRWGAAIVPGSPGTRYLDWQLEDPAGSPPAEVRPVDDEIDRRVHGLLAELVPTESPADR
jgi:hypothetical protein